VTTTPTSLLRRLQGARGAALLSIGARGGGWSVIVVGVIGAALCCGALARADTTPSPTTPTTTTDAPPPDPYQAPKKTVTHQTVPRHVTVTHAAPVAPVRTYIPPATTRSQAPVRVTRPSVKPHAKPHPKPVRKHRSRPAVHAKHKPISLAPLSSLIASIRTPLAAPADSDPPFRLLAGIALAVLAVTGTGLLLLSLRMLRTGVGLR
jgi:hypothetical protein